MKVRGALAVFALTNFLLGMAALMFIFCTSSPKSIHELHSLLTSWVSCTQKDSKQVDLLT